MRTRVRCAIAMGVALVFLVVLEAERTASGQVIFDSSRFFAAGDEPRGLVAVDFDGDGELDLGASNMGSNEVSFLRGDGTGAFELPRRTPVGLQPEFLVAADFDRDGDSDLAVANRGANSVSILLGDGAGGFASGGTIDLGGSPGSVAAADFDEDGLLDLAVVLGNGGVAVFLGDGAGQFRPSQTLSLLQTASLVVASSLNANADAHLDLAVATAVCPFACDYRIAILLGDGTGSFFHVQDVGGWSTPAVAGLIAADFDDAAGQNLIDLAVVNGFSWAGAVSVLHGDGTGNFPSEQTFDTGPYNQCTASADFDRDGHLDLAFGAIDYSGTSVARVVLGDGVGRFGTPSSFYGLNDPRAVVAADLDNDGYTDLVVANAGSDNVAVLRNKTFDESICARGNVNGRIGPIADVLLVNGSSGGPARLVTVAIGAPIQVDLHASPAGPNPARYGLWVWQGVPANPFGLDVGTSTLGCTVNPTPFQPFATPQPILCMRGGLPPVFFTGIKEVRSRSNAPWSARRNGGFGRATELTLQCVLEDGGAFSSDGYSVTNAVTLRVR